MDKGAVTEFRKLNTPNRSLAPLTGGSLIAFWNLNDLALILGPLQGPIILLIIIPAQLNS